jgi:predicted RNA methylase
VIEPDDVARVLHALFIAVEGTQLRQEERKKAIEVAAFLRELAPLVRPGRLLVDAAAGKAYVGLLAAALVGVDRVLVLEREPSRAAACRDALGRLQARAQVDIVVADVADRAAWPDAPDIVAALHACGPASDAILDAAVASRARALLLVPCCYAHAVPFAAAAEALADATGVPRHAEVRRRFVTAAIDAERTLRLEAAGYETTVVPLVAPTVTPHHLLWRARRVGEPRRMAEAAARLGRLRAAAT